MWLLPINELPMGLLRLQPFLVLAEFRFTVCERARVNVRAKGRAVNSVFLVQLRKMLATDFCGSTWIGDVIENFVPRRIQGLGFVR
jgi:hypothetical protein